MYATGIEVAMFGLARRLGGHRLVVSKQGDTGRRARADGTVNGDREWPEGYTGLCGPVDVSRLTAEEKEASLVIQSTVPP